MAWQQKIRKRGAKWNELKGELKAILDVAPFPTLANEAIYCQQLTTYKRSFPKFKVKGVHSPFCSFDSSSTKSTPHQEFTL
jgi:hypothetical protein